MLLMHCISVPCWVCVYRVCALCTHASWKYVRIRAKFENFTVNDPNPCMYAMQRLPENEREISTDALYHIDVSCYISQNESVHVHTWWWNGKHRLILWANNCFLIKNEFSPRTAFPIFTNKIIWIFNGKKRSKKQICNEILLVPWKWAHYSCNNGLHFSHLDWLPFIKNEIQLTESLFRKSGSNAKYILVIIYVEKPIKTRNQMKYQKKREKRIFLLFKLLVCASSTVSHKKQSSKRSVCTCICLFPLIKRAFSAYMCATWNVYTSSAF